MSTLHITNGDHAGDKLRAVVDGTVSITADPLHEGPALPLDGAAWRDMRAQYLASDWHTTLEEAQSALNDWDGQLDCAGDYDEVVLWFEHDLFDQLLLVRTLDILSRMRCTARVPRVSLICINEFLGYLTPAQLRGLWPTRGPVTDAQYSIASQVWEAYRQPDPSVLLDTCRQLKTDRDAWAPMPFLADALERFFEEFPSTSNGLARTAHAILQVLDEAPLTGADLFRRNQALEARMYLGDTGFFNIVRHLAGGRVPLVALSAPAADPANGRGDDQETGEAAAARMAEHPITITEAGRAVLHGGLDAVRLNGVNLWRGGVHLTGPEAAWRWDPVHKTLISWS